MSEPYYVSPLSRSVVHAFKNLPQPPPQKNILVTQPSNASLHVCQICITEFKETSNLHSTPPPLFLSSWRGQWPDTAYLIPRQYQ